MDKPPHDPNILIALALRIGVGLSFALLLAGVFWTILLSLLDGRTPPPVLHDTTTGALHGHVLLLHAGLVVLMATPALRILAAIWAFSQARDRRYTFIATLVLTIVFASVLISFLGFRSR